MNKRQKKKRGIYTRFKDEELWSLDVTIAKFILPRLKKFKKVTGCPGQFLLDEEGNLRQDPGFVKDAEQRWQDILDKMIWSFGEVAYGDREPLISDDFITTVIKEEDGKKVYSSNIDPDVRQEWRSSWDKYNEQIQVGLVLFAKYFRNLWW